jgi:molybdopterin-containing oxidoreductase family iron-sulfur binding subunit
LDVLLILGGNPVYAAPFDIDFGKALDDFNNAKGVSVHLGHYEDETSRRCQWHVPETHYLEMWGDARAYDGTASIIQPLIAPLYPGARSGHEVLAAVIDSTTRSNPATQQTIMPAVTSPESEPGKSSGAPAAVPATQQTSIEPLAGRGGYDIVRAFWRRWKEQKGQQVGGDFEAYWAGALVKGVLDKSADDFPAQQASVRGDLAAALAAGAATQPAATQPAVTQPAGGQAGGQAGNGPALTVVFRPDPSVWDGSLANNGWLQELPKQILRTTWDNLAVVSPNTAKSLGFAKEEYDESTGLNAENPYPTRDNARLVNVKYRGRLIDPGGPGLPLWVLPGHPDGVVTIHLGYGRTATSLHVGGKRGKSAYAIRPSDAPWFGPGAELVDSHESYRVAVVQHHQVIAQTQNDLRDIVRFGDDSTAALNLSQQKADAAERLKRVRLSVLSIEEVEAAQRSGQKPPAAKLGAPVYPDDAAHSDSINPEAPEHPGGHNQDYPAWAMVIDQTACIGCNACVIACQSENNIAVVGYEQVTRERELHWIRIDTYYESEPGNPETPANTFFQPLPCMHCEKAPCELVCPVEATQHDVEGLNVMTYNRCVGTRYCSNNCPYKVRRFNFLQYADTTTPVLMLMNNPEVTVRNRGVMEKCTYCIQRISRGRIESKKAAARATDSTISDEHKAKLLRQSKDAIEGIDTACAQSCPTEAIVFGNMANENSRVSKLKREPTNYGLLVDRGTQPRTTYLPRVYNRNPEALKAEGRREKKAEG